MGEWGSRGVGEWLTRIMARITRIGQGVGEWGGRGVAHADYGTDNTDRSGSGGVEE
ncbi:MAG: hypothetical protein SWX82_06170 [Cyanobacteriota bacterium]|nr:hypothetical protein [Cyanobacteriota bacterium]